MRLVGIFTGASDVERQRDRRSLSIQLDATSQNFTDDVRESDDNTGKTVVAVPPLAAGATSDLAEDRDDEEDEDLSYDSDGERLLMSISMSIVDLYSA